MHTSTTARAGSAATAAAVNPAANDPPLPIGSGEGGSTHWKYERILSVATLPLLGSLFFVPEGNALINFGLGLVLPVHAQMGMECIIQDYLPARRVGALHAAVMWATRALAGLTVFACFLFNTTDIGVGAFLSGIWCTARARAKAALAARKA
jgi:succinate dehydrogenase (ubiquinone) membrane anchor subunit